MTKTTLLTAAAISAMVFAGAAQAGVQTATINGVAASASTANAAPGPYTIAAERTNTADSTADGAVVLTNVFTTPAVINGAKTYEVRIDVTGGTLPASGTPTLTIGQAASAGAVATPGAVVCTISLRTATSIAFTCSIAAPGAGAGTITATNFVYTGAVANSDAEANIAFASSVNDVTGGALVSTIDASAATTLVRYSNAVLNFSAAERIALAGLPDFRLLKTAVVGNAATVAVNGLSTSDLALYTVTDTSTTMFRTGLATATTVARDGIINGATVVLSGPALGVAGISATVGGATAASTSGSSRTFNLTNAQADALSAGGLLAVTTTGANPIPATQFITQWTPIYAAGFTAPTTAQSVNSGRIVLDGTNIIAPWFSGSQAQTQSQVRLTNFGTSDANVRISVANGVFNFNGSPTAFNDTACTTVFTLPVAGDLIIGQTQVFGCFGAFLRGDVLISIEGASGDVTAKMRNTSSAGNFETTLGRASGATVTTAQ